MNSIHPLQQTGAVPPCSLKSAGHCPGKLALSFGHRRHGAVEDPGALDRELDRMLKASGSTDAPCPLNADGLRRLVIEYLNDYDAELALLPERAGEGHWNLWQWDEPGEFKKDSYFVVVAVWPGGLEFVCGYGVQQTVHDFADNNFPDDVRQVVPELVRQFTVPCGSLRVGRAVAEAWAGRGLGVRAEPLYGHDSQERAP